MVGVMRIDDRPGIGIHSSPEAQSFTAGQHIASGVILDKQGGFGSGRNGHARCPLSLPGFRKVLLAAAKAGCRSPAAAGTAYTAKRGRRVRLLSTYGRCETIIISCGSNGFPFKTGSNGRAASLPTTAGSPRLRVPKISPTVVLAQSREQDKLKPGTASGTLRCAPAAERFATLRSLTRQKPPRQISPEMTNAMAKAIRHVCDNSQRDREAQTLIMTLPWFWRGARRYSHASRNCSIGKTRSTVGRILPDASAP